MIKVLTMDGRLVGDDCAVVATVSLKGPRFCDASVFVRPESSSMMTQVTITSLLIASYCALCCVLFCWFLLHGFCRCDESAIRGCTRFSAILNLLHFSYTAKDIM